MVSASIGGTFLVSLVIVLSTGLLTIRDFPVATEAKVEVSQSFNQSMRLFSGWSNPNLWWIGYGIQYLNLSYPEGTTINYAFPNFETTDPQPNVDGGTVSLTAEVDLFAWDLACEKAALTSRKDNELIYPADYCTHDLAESLILSLEKEPEEKVREVIQGACDGRMAPPSEYTHIFFVEASHSEIDSTQVVRLQINGTVKDVYLKVSMCEARYNITRGTITHEGTTTRGNTATSVTVLPNASAQRLKNVTSFEIAKTIVSGKSLMSLGPGGFADLPGRDWVDINQDVLRAAGTQLGKEYLMQDSSDNIIGTLETTQRRLVMRPLLFALVEAVAATLVLLTLYLILSGASKPVVSGDPDTIARLATILARSGKLQTTLESIDGLQKKDLEDHLKSSQYCTRITEEGSFEIAQTDKQHDHTGATATGLLLEFDGEAVVPDSTKTLIPKGTLWWQPILLKLPLRVTLIVVLLGTIAALEAIIRRSGAQDGFVAIAGDDGSYIRYSWVFVPALFMVCLQITLAGVVFNVKLFQPYHILRRKNMQARHNLLDNLLGKVALICLGQSIRKRQLAVSAVSAAMLLAPFLTIVTSGLYTVKEVDLRESLKIQQLDSWTFASPSYKAYDADDSAFDTPSETPSENMIPGMVLQLNHSYPALTYEQFAFPDFGNPLSDSSFFTDAPLGGSDGVRLEAVVPAIRVAMNCTPIPVELISTSAECAMSDDSSSVCDTYCAWSISAPPPPHTNCSTIYSMSLYNFSTAIKPGQYFDGVARMNNETAGCPLITFAFGYMSASCDVEAVNMLTCRPYVEQLDVEATFQIPGFTVDANHPPRPIEGTARRVSGFEKLSALPETVQRPSVEFSYLVDYNAFLSSLEDIPSLNVWFKLLIESVGGPSPESLLGPDGGPRIARGLDRVFGIRTAQMLSAHARSVNTTPDTLPSERPAPFDAVVTFPRRTRLVQDEVSTRVLQALLSAIAVLCTAAFLAMDTRAILPANPCSIAVVAKLLAGAKLLGPDVIPPGTEWYGDKELEERVFGGHLFSMGWWCRTDSRGNERPRFGIDLGSHPAYEREIQRSQ